MIRLLRLVGILNAAIWFGGAVLFTFVVGPAFFSDEMKQLLGKPHAGGAAQVALARYYVFHLVCGGVALAHLGMEALYRGRIERRGLLALMFGVLLLGIAGGQGIQPKLRALHVTMYAPGTPEPDRAAATRSFRTWHGVAQVLNLAVLGGALACLLHVTRREKESGYWR